MEPYQRQFEVLLPIGYTDQSGRTHRQAWIRKMRGHEEALLCDPSLTSGRLVSELICRCLVRLGEVEGIDSGLVAQLYTADRNYLLFEIRRRTLGDRLSASYPCPHCGTSVMAVEDLGQVEVRRLTEGEQLKEITVSLDDGYTDRDGATHLDLELSLPLGEDEEMVSSAVAKDPMRALDALLLRCIRRFGHLPRAALDGYGIKIIRDLTMGDRQRIHAALGQQAPGVDLRRTIDCGSCGSRFEGVLDVSNFFAPG